MDRTVYEIIKELEANSSTNKKLEILKKNKNNIVLKDFFYHALSPEKVFYIQKIPPYQSYQCQKFQQILLWAISQLDMLSSRIYTGHEGIAHLQTVLSNLSPENANLIERIIKKDPNCGVSTTTVNKVWKNLIKEYPIALCERLNEKTKKNIVFPSYVQNKEDGMRCCIHVTQDKVEFRTRSGKVFELNEEIALTFKAIGSGYVYDGEALVVDKNGNILSRKIGNGILNKAIKGTISEKEKNMIVFHLWDMIYEEDFWKGYCNVKYPNRLSKLKNRVNGISSNRVKCLDTEIVNNWEEIETIFQKSLASGKEGVIVKNIDSIWENKRLKTHIKLKAEKDADLLCIGFEPHSKNPNMIGSLLLTTSCGKLKTSCGSGLTDEDRLKDPKYYLDKIIEITYNEIITRVGEETKSLFLPIYQTVRLDKTTANSLEELK